MNANSPHLVIQESGIHNRGIFTLRDVQKDDDIFEVQGAKKTVAEVEVDGVFSHISANAYRFSRGYYISPAGRLGDFLNHSCEPNAYVRKENNRLFVSAIDTIRARVEVLIDYSTIMARDDTWTMTCNCGSNKCRSTITMFTLLPESIQKKYREAGTVPAYILSI